MDDNNIWLEIDTIFKYYFNVSKQEQFYNLFPYEREKECDVYYINKKFNNGLENLWWGLTKDKQIEYLCLAKKWEERNINKNIIHSK